MFNVYYWVTVVLLLGLIWFMRPGIEKDLKKDTSTTSTIVAGLVIITFIPYLNYILLGYGLFNVIRVGATLYAQWLKEKDKK